ncbi:MAG: gas vesicle protein GvpL [Dehalococcoidia bacterium]
MPYSGDVRVAPSGSTDAQAQAGARYLYCVADSVERVGLGPIGLEGHEVYTIPYRDICAVVHDCQAQPYQSADQEAVKAWVLTHQRVVDEAWERWGTVLPLGFDTIIRGDAGIEPEDNMRSWLQKDYENLRRKLERVRGKAEYGVQAFWHASVIATDLTETNPEISRLEAEIRSMPRGVAYMLKQKLENVLKKEMEAKADQCFRDFYHRIRQHVDDLRVERTKQGDGDTQMIMNLSCLVYRDKAQELGEELEGIDRMEGFSVRFTGPWPPYSFVGA